MSPAQLFSEWPASASPVTINRAHRTVTTVTCVAAPGDTPDAPGSQRQPPELRCCAHVGGGRAGPAVALTCTNRVVADRHPSVGRVKRRWVVGLGRNPANRALKSVNDQYRQPQKPKAAQAISISLALNSMRRTAPPSRPYGRYAVGLRPNLDPDADFDAAQPGPGSFKTSKNKRSRGVLTARPSASGMTCRNPSCRGYVGRVKRR